MFNKPLTGARDDFRAPVGQIAVSPKKYALPFSFSNAASYTGITNQKLYNPFRNQTSLAINPRHRTIEMTRGETASDNLKLNGQG